MKTKSIMLLSVVIFLLTTGCVENNADIKKPNLEYYTSDYFLNDSLTVSSVIQIGSDCRLIDATDALIIDEDDTYFHFLSKAFVIDDNNGAKVNVKRSDFKIRKRHINKIVAYIRNAPMNLEDIATWTESNNIDDYKETKEVEFAEDEDLKEVEVEEWN